MKRELIKYLVCPKCKNILDLKVFAQSKIKYSRGIKNEVKEGILTCSCGQWFPIINFIPRVLVCNLREDYSYFSKKYQAEFDRLKIKFRKINYKKSSNQNQVKKSFANKWCSQPNWGFNRNTKSFMQKWILEKYGWRTIKLYKREISSRKMILDAGTGLGREVRNFCQYNTK